MVAFRSAGSRPTASKLTSALGHLNEVFDRSTVALLGDAQHNPAVVRGLC
jgi:hypothetical protein